MKQYLLAFSLTIIFFSCKKDNEETPVKTSTIDPLSSIVNMPDAIHETSSGSAGKYQVGIRFLTYKKGTIKRLGLRSPSAGTYRLQLYTFVTTDSTSIVYPMIVAPQRLGYVDVTIDAAAATNGSVVWGNISSVNVEPWTNDGVGKVRMYGICFNDLDNNQFQHRFPTGASMPIWYGGYVLSLQRYTFCSSDDMNAPAWQSHGGGFSNLVFGDIRMEFEYQR
ncbi:MAG: hypothetical protein ACK5NK_12325 [Niabella sp.]